MLKHSPISVPLCVYVRTVIDHGKKDIQILCSLARRGFGKGRGFIAKNFTLRQVVDKAVKKMLNNHGFHKGI